MPLLSDYFKEQRSAAVYLLCFPVQFYIDVDAYIDRLGSRINVISFVYADGINSQHKSHQEETVSLWNNRNYANSHNAALCNNTLIQKFIYFLLWVQSEAWTCFLSAIHYCLPPPYDAFIVATCKQEDAKKTSASYWTMNRETKLRVKEAFHA